MQIDKGKSGVELPEVIVAGADIPQYIFSCKFKQYLFFDADIGSSDGLISAVQLIATTCFGLNSQIKVFASSSREFLGYLNPTTDWSVEVNKISKKLRDSGDCNGLIFVEANSQWALYQNRPVDVGVFAFESDKDLQGIASTVDDSFFAPAQIALWLSRGEKRDIQLVDGFGRDFLFTLIMNYS